MGQLETHLRVHGFEVESHRSALFFPPSEKPRWMRFHRFFEKLGKGTGLPLAAGVVIIEATKNVFSLPPGGAGVSVKNPLEVLEGMKPATGKPIRNKDFAD